jgi:hypothetical protein
MRPFYLGEKDEAVMRSKGNPRRSSVLCLRSRKDGKLDLCGGRAGKATDIRVYLSLAFREEDAK